MCYVASVERTMNPEGHCAQVKVKTIQGTVEIYM